MSPAAETAPKAAIYAFRFLAVGSTAVVAAQLAPIVNNTAVPHAIALTSSKEGMLATSGARRIASNARRSATKRAQFVAQGAPAVLSACIARPEPALRASAMDALAVLLEEPDARVSVAEDRALLGVLVASPVEKAAPLWDALFADVGTRDLLAKDGVWDALADACRRSLGEDATGDAATERLLSMIDAQDHDNDAKS